MNVLDIFANADTIAEEGTGNTVGLRATSPERQELLDGD
jgi:hypothetical protein